MQQEQAQLEALTEEFNATKLTMGKEQIRLNTELSGCRNELAACSHRLSKTHEALGITADKARALESSQGRLQIDLDGTLSTLEDATRRHHDELIEADTLRKRREAELIGLSDGGGVECHRRGLGPVEPVAPERLRETGESQRQ